MVENFSDRDKSGVYTINSEGYYTEFVGFPLSKMRKNKNIVLFSVLDIFYFT